MWHRIEEHFDATLVYPFVVINYFSTNLYKGRLISRDIEPVVAGTDKDILMALLNARKRVPEVCIFRRTSGVILFHK